MGRGTWDSLLTLIVVAIIVVVVRHKVAVNVIRLLLGLRQTCSRQFS